MAHRFYLVVPGGRSFFEKITWVMAALFILGALGLSLIKSKEKQHSSLADFKTSAPVAPRQAPVPVEPVPAGQTDED